MKKIMHHTQPQSPQVRKVEVTLNKDVIYDIISKSLEEGSRQLIE